jgi:hypothetical protein
MSGTTHATSRSFSKPGKRDGMIPLKKRRTTMARAEKAEFEDAVAELKRDPAHPVRLQVGDMEVELRVVEATPAPLPVNSLRFGDRLAAHGPWEGESTEELLELIHEGRKAGGSAEPPKL